MPVTVITYVSTCFLSAVTMMSEQMIPSAVAESIIIIFLTNENAVMKLS